MYYASNWEVYWHAMGTSAHFLDGIYKNGSCIDWHCDFPKGRTGRASYNKWYFYDETIVWQSFCMVSANHWYRLIRFWFVINIYMLIFPPSKLLAIVCNIRDKQPLLTSVWWFCYCTSVDTVYTVSLSTQFKCTKTTYRGSSPYLIVLLGYLAIPFNGPSKAVEVVGDVRWSFSQWALSMTRAWLQDLEP